MTAPSTRWERELRAIERAERLKRGGLVVVAVAALGWFLYLLAGLWQ